MCAMGLVLLLLLVLVFFMHNHISFLCIIMTKHNRRMNLRLKQVFHEGAFFQQHT
jgi:hypothetical protein